MYLFFTVILFCITESLLGKVFIYKTLFAGLMGNSEVGHLNIGAGRVVYQDIVSINLAFETSSVVKNPALIEAAKRPAKKIHLLGITFYSSVL